ncbi:PREDICTED: uncharacterized protein LOC109587763 isoform X1 [Amphimedon queenslandica]|uniref:Uncharacterized protein n=1 Tax=Amphimedon queenslandica TaxID=400682 RepID=A0AAN0JRR0_AMPQE|nr:PREDICTED: uncharacterized protein LOC109587763 isoform X1 [Amphimedon queenslandica]|eukprot:XP_019859546.1 PREDICTED: uncharacterized protein LOC109587763 isoform X1 [Amphimedon queenslandica]
MAEGQYQLGVRVQHTTAVVGEVLYCWGGARGGLDGSHDSPTKKQCTSAIDAFNLLSGVWSSQPTRGSPPLGIMGVSCTTINNNIYYFGGWCGHDFCFHNSLNCLDTLTLKWKEIQPTSDNFVTKRGFGGMIVMGSEGEPQQLLVIGGEAPISTITQYHHQFEYNKMAGVDDLVRTNEQNIYNLSNGQWTVLSVSGQCCPPTSSFIVERITHNKGIMYGGSVDGGIATNSIYLFQLSHNTINWECLNQGAISGLWPKERRAHASTIINGVSSSPILVVIGGRDNRDQLVNDCLLLDTNQYNWMKIPLPDSVTGRYAHTVSSFVVDHTHVFLIIVGGGVEREQKHVGGGVMEWFSTPVTDPNITMVVELVFNDGQWSVGPVLDSVSIPLLYEQILKERRKESNEFMTDKEKELQVIIESLRHDLQVARINNQSLQEALLETQSLSEKTMLTLETQSLETKTLLTKRKRDQEDSPHSDNSKKFKTDEPEESVEEKQIMTGEYEKLKAIVADKEVFITELLKGKTQVEEQLKEKQIVIDDFKTTVSEKDAYISKLLKEKSQQQERITSQEEQSIKETSSVEVQFNYLIPSMGKRYASKFELI